jgi:hypothetical protein
VDIPESALIAGVGGKTSSVTTAFYINFGDNFQHPSRTTEHTLVQLADIEKKVDPWDLKEYQKAASSVCLNGVHRPFWMNWAPAEPSTFLTPEPLHHWHKQFWDHDLQWCLNVVGHSELDFCFSILPPHTGFCHFKAGISHLKQVSGWDHHDIQRYIVPVIAGAVDPEFLIAIRSLLDFHYWAQSPVIEITYSTIFQQASKLFILTNMQLLLVVDNKENMGQLSIGRYQSLNGFKVLF